MTSDRSAPRVLFQLSGSIAAYKACHVISRLVQAGCEVRTVATDGALQFVGAATLEGLTGRPVATDTFAPGSQMDHIHLVRWADLVILCPATANTINRLAAGIADDLVGTMFLAHDFRAPYIVVPAMNAAMFAHPATQRSLAQLRDWDVEILDPDAGSLACGEVGAGRLPDPDRIVAHVLRRLGPAAVEPAAERLTVLVTSGGTKVPIDGVRSITNTSSGATGATLAAHLVGRGHRVTLLHARGAVVPEPSPRLTTEEYVTFGDLARALEHTLTSGAFDAVVHLAAVSDYDVDRIDVGDRTQAPDPTGKLDSSGDEMTIHLRRNPKLLDRLRDWSGPGVVVVGFKLTNGAGEPARLAAVAELGAATDLVVHNDLTEIGGGRHRATLYRDLDAVAVVDDNAALATALEAELVRSLSAG